MKFRNFGELEDHEREHAKDTIETTDTDNPYSCTKCNKKFTAQSQKKDHEKGCMEKTQGSLMFSCVICENKFSKYNDLKKHKRSHSAEKPFSCTKCDKMFVHFQIRKAQEKGTMWGR